MLRCAKLRKNLRVMNRPNKKYGSNGPYAPNKRKGMAVYRF